MSEWQVKKFWTSVTTEPVEDGFAVHLDGRTIRTPAKAQLIMPTRKFADRVAKEWQAQGDKVDPATMPATRCANAAIDKVADQKNEVAELLVAYCDSDLLCYRATSPAELVSHQSEVWDPYLDWAAENLGARLHSRKGVVHRPQNPDDIARLSGQVHALSNFELAAFHDLVSLTGSLILGFASVHQISAVRKIWDVSRLDETWQERQWGKDAEAEVLTAQKRRAFLHAAEFFRLSRVEH